MSGLYDHGNYYYSHGTMMPPNRAQPFTNGAGFREGRHPPGLDYDRQPTRMPYSVYDAPPRDLRYEYDNRHPPALDYNRHPPALDYNRHPPALDYDRQPTHYGMYEGPPRDLRYEYDNRHPPALDYNRHPPGLDDRQPTRMPYQGPRRSHYEDMSGGFREGHHRATYGHGQGPDHPRQYPQDPYVRHAGFGEGRPSDAHASRAILSPQQPSNRIHRPRDRNVGNVRPGFREDRRQYESVAESSERSVQSPPDTRRRDARASRAILSPQQSSNRIHRPPHRGRGRRAALVKEETALVKEETALVKEEII